jgi:RNA polymerase sigma-70 factor (ECF subfamily)
VVDENTIARATWGDRDALGAIFREHQPTVLRYLRSMALSNAEDVASQVWVDAATSLRRFRGDNDDLRRWLLTIARRRMIDAFRSRSRRPEQVVAEVPNHASAEEIDASFDRVSWATHALSQLPPAQAEVVYLRAVVGYSVAEVAAMVDKSPGAVRVLAHRGLERLLAYVNQRARGDDDVSAAMREEAARWVRVDVR